MKGAGRSRLHEVHAAEQRGAERGEHGGGRELEARHGERLPVAPDAQRRGVASARVAHQHHPQRQRLLEQRGGVLALHVERRVEDGQCGGVQRGGRVAQHIGKPLQQQQHLQRAVHGWRGVYAMHRHGREWGRGWRACMRRRPWERAACQTGGTHDRMVPACGRTASPMRSTMLATQRNTSACTAPRCSCGAWVCVSARRRAAHVARGCACVRACQRRSGRARRAAPATRTARSARAAAAGARGVARGAAQSRRPQSPSPPRAAAPSPPPSAPRTRPWRARPAWRRARRRRGGARRAGSAAASARCTAGSAAVAAACTARSARARLSL